MSIADGKFHDLELSYYGGERRIDDERNKPIAYTLFRDTVNKGFINDVVSDEEMDKAHESSGSMASVHFIGTNYFSEFLSNEDKRILATGLDSKTANRFLEAKTGAEYQKVIENNDVLQRRMLKVSTAIGTSISSANQVLGIIDSLASTSLNDTDEGREKILKAGYAIGAGIMFGEDEMDKVANEIGINLDSTETVEDQMISGLATAAISKDGYGGNISRHTIRDKGIMGAISEDIGMNYRAIFGVRNADPYLNSRNISIEDNNVVINATEIETRVTEELSESYDSKAGVIAMAGMDMITSTAIAKQKFVGSSDSFTSKMRMSLVNESMSGGDYGAAGTYGMLFGIAGAIAESLILGMIIGAVAGAISGGGIGALPGAVVGGAGGAAKGVATGIKSYKAARALAKTGSIAKKVLTSKAFVQSANMAAKTWAQTNNETGYGLAKSRTLGDAKLMRNMAFDAATMYVSMGLSDRLTTVGSGRLMRTIAKNKHAGNLSGFYGGLALHNVVSTAGDISIDMGTDIIAHTVIEHAYGLMGKGYDPLLPSQESMTSLSGDTRITGGGFLTQLGSRFAARVAGRQISRVAGWGKAKGPGNEFVVGSRLWSDNIEDTMFAGAKKAPGMRMLNSLSSGIFQDNLTNISSFAREVYPDRGNAALWEMLETSPDPYKTYLALWKLQEIQTNRAYSHIRALTSPFRSIETRGDRGIISAADSVIKLYTKDPGLDRVGQFLSLAENSSVISIEDKSTFDLLSKKIIDYVINGESNSPTDMSNRLREGIAFISKRILIDEDEVFKGSGKVGTSFISSLDQEIAKKIKSSTDNETINSLSTFMKDYSAGGMKVDSATIDLSNVSRAVLSDETLARKTNFVLNEDNKKVLEDYLVLAAEQAQQRGLTQKNLISSEIERAERLYASTNNENEKRRLESSLRELRAFREVLGYDPDGKKAVKGLETILDFFTRTVATARGDKDRIPIRSLDELMGQEPISGISHAVDFIGTAQAFSRIYTESMRSYLGYSDGRIATARVKGFSENQIVNFVQKRLIPLISVYDAFYSSMDDSSRANARSIMKTVYGALNSRTDESSKSFSRIIDNHITYLNSTETAIASSKDLISTMKTLDGISSRSSIRELMGENANTLNMLGVLISSPRPTDSGVEIIDEDRGLINELFYPSYQNMFDEILRNDLTIDDKIEMNRTLLAAAAARQVSLAYLDNPSRTPEQAVDIANDELSKSGLSVRVQKLVVGDNENPQIIVDTKDSPLNNNQILSELTGILEVFGKSSAAQYSSRSSMAAYDALYDRTTFNFIDGKTISIQELKDRLNKDVPNAIQAIRGITIGYLSGDGDPSKIGAGLTSEIMNFLNGTKFITTMTKLSPDEQAAFAWKVAKIAAGPSNVSFEYSLKGGDYVLKLGNSTIPVLANNKNFAIIDGSSTTQEEDAILTEKGFVAVNSGAGAQRVYVQLSPAFKEHNISEVVNSLVDTYRDMANSYDDLDGSVGTFAYHAWKGMTEISSDINKTLPSNPSDAYSKIIDVITSAWNKASVSPSGISLLDDLSDAARAESIITLSDGTRIDIRKAINNYLTKGAPGLTQAVGESIASIRKLVDFSGELSSEDTLDDLSVRIKELINNLPKDSIMFDEEKRGIIDTISRLDSQELATQMSSVEDFKAEVMKIFEDIEIAYRRDMDEASRLTAVREYALGNMSNPERINFLDSVYRNSFGSTPSKEIIAEAVRKSDEADMYSNLRKAAFKEINDDAIQALKSKDPDKALANIITITMTRGTVLDFSAAEMSKRASAVFIGKSINREEAASLISELNNTILEKTMRGDYGTQARNVAQTRQVSGIKRPLSLRIVISRLPDGDNQMPPELIRAFGNYYGIEADGSFKPILDVYGSIGKTVYSSNSSLIDPQTNTLTVRIGYDNLKRLSAAGVAWASDAISAGEEGIHLRGTEEIAKFISSHSLHAGTYANTKQVGNTSQTDSSLLIRYASASRQKTGSTSMKSSAAGAVSVKDAYYQSYRELQKTSWGTGYVYTAGAINDIDDNTGKFTILDNETLSRFSPTFENVMAGSGLLPSPRLEIGIKLLADLASDSMKRQKMPTKVRDVIDRIYDQHNKLVDLNPKEMVNASEVLLRFLSDPEMHPSGQHVFRTTIDGREAYFIGVTRSPTPREVQPFMPITAVLNTRENGLRLNEAGWKLFGGDFDGDLALGLAPIKPSSLARAVAATEYGSTYLSYIDIVSKNLGDHLMSLTRSSIQKNKLYDHFVSSLNPSDRIVPESGVDSNEDLSKGTQALSGAIQTLTPLKSILHSLYTGSGSIRLNNDFSKAITDIAKNLSTSYATQNVQGTKFEDAFDVSPLKNIGEDTRLVFIDPSPSPDITKDSMVEIGAIGSVRYITAVDAGNTGTDGARRSVVVTELTPDNSKPTNKKYNVLVLESMKDKIGVLKVAGVPLLREGESFNKNRILNIASSLATQLRNKQTANIVELDKPLYATVPQTILESVNAALVDTKLHGQRIIMSKYKGDPNKFVEDILKFTSEAYAASLLDIDMSITQANNRGIIDYKLSDIDRSNIDSGLRNNTSFKQESARTVVSEFSEVIKDNLIAINNLVRMSEPDNTIPLSQQDTWKKMFSSNSNDLPESVYKIISIEENGGIGWRDEFGFSKINKNTELFKEIDGGLMSIRNPLSNGKKINFYNDLSKIVKSFDVFTSRLYTTDERELNRVTKALEKEPLYIDSSKYVNSNLPNLVYSTLKSEGKPVSIGTVERILKDIGVSKRDPETWYAPKVNSPEYILGNGIQKNKGNGSRLMVSVLTNPDGSEMSMFDLNRSIDKLITSRQLLRERNERYLNDLRMVLNGMIHVLSRDSQIRAVAAAEGMGAQVVSHIRSMYKNGNITSTSSVGGYRVALEGLVDKVSADEIEDRYVINKNLDILRKFSTLELVNGTTKMNISNYLIEGDGDC
jgi:hypothetical protein